MLKRFEDVKVNSIITIPHIPNRENDLYIKTISPPDNRLTKQFPHCVICIYSENYEKYKGMRNFLVDDYKVNVVNITEAKFVELEG